MNDDERDLRDLLERKAGSVGTVAPRLPDAMRKRGRRRQLGTALVSGVTVLAVLVGSVGVLRAIDTGTDRRPTPADDPWSGYEVFERTATVGSFTITSESDWYLVRPATDGLCGGEKPCEALQLSNFDPGLDRSVCDEPLPPDGVALVVSSALELNPRDVPPWPMTIEDPNTVGRCGEGRYFHFLDEGNRYPYTAWLGQGPAAGNRELARLQRSFQDMRIEPTALAAMGRAAYVIAGGENAAGPWRLELRPSTSDAPTANVDVSVVSPEGGAGAADFSVPYGSPIEQSGGDPVFGAVTKEAVSVEIRPDVMLPGPAATIVPLPPSLPFDFDLFFASHEGDEPPLAVPVGAAGDPIGNVTGMSEGGNSKLFEILGTEGALMTDRSTGITCYAVTSDHGFIDGCAEEVTLQTIPLPGERGQILVFSHVDAIRLSGLELDVDGAETLAGSTCHGPVCVMGIPPGSGTGTLWLLQKGQRADSAPIAWTPEGVERT
jgi:hypothetical protein